MQQFQQKIRSAYKSKFVLPLPTQQKTKKGQKNRGGGGGAK